MGEENITLEDYRQIFVERSHLLEASTFEYLTNLAAQSNQSLEPLLIEKSFITSNQFLQLASDYYELPSTSLAIGDINEEALDFMTVDDALKLLAIPFDIADHEIKVAVVRPHDPRVLHKLRHSGNYTVKLFISTEQAIRRALILYDLSIEEIIMRMTSRRNNGLSEGSHTGGGDLGVSIIETAVMHGASDVHLEPFEDVVLVRLRIDGLLQQIARLPTDFYRALVAYYKVQATLKIDEHRLPQDGRMSFDIKDQEVNVRLSIIPSLWGEKVVMRVLPKESHLYDINTVGLLDGDLETIKRNLRRPFGMVLVSGPTGSGKTTSLYAFLQEIGAEKINIVNISTIEDPIEYTISRVTQMQTQSGIDLTFASGLRALLRQDPDIIMVGEIRDEETADIAVRSALVGRLLLSSIHTSDAVGAIPRLLDMGVEPYLVASTLTLVVAQRLARRLCTYCRQSYHLDEQMVERLNEQHQFGEALIRLRERGILSHTDYRELHFYKAVGCNKCNNSGYSGRTGLYELLEVNDKIRKLISSHTDSTLLKKAAIKNGMATMFDDGLAKASLGIIDLDELTRVAYE